MRYKNKLLIAFFVIALAISGLYRFGWPIVINGCKDAVINLSHPAAPVFNPLEEVDFSSGNNVAYLLIDQSDIADLPSQMSKAGVLECRNNETLQNLKHKFHFKKSGGDMATCSSEILIYHGDSLFFCSSLVLDNTTIGIQNRITGWAKAEDMEGLGGCFLGFKPVYRPLLVMPCN